MTISEGASLLTFLDSPVVVGDPEGRVIYVNPAFQQRFRIGGGQVQGEHLSSLFSGGGREATLRAVAEVCDRGETLRFRLREGESGYLALVSPIHNEGQRLGVIILLTDEPLADERVLAFHREMQEPLEELRLCLEELIEQTGGRRDEHHRGAVEAGLRALERASKWSGELFAVLSGRGTAVSGGSRLDPIRVVHQIAGRVASDFQAAGVEFDLLVPAQLELAKGDGPRLETALVHLLRQRLEGAQPGDLFTLSARAAGEGAKRSLLFAVVDPPRPDGGGSGEAEPPIFRDTISALGGRVHTTADLEAGRVTIVELGAAADS
jgi:hypothetical protein